MAIPRRGVVRPDAPLQPGVPIQPDGSRAEFVKQRLLARNPVSEAFFTRESERLARACERMAGRFLSGGRLLAFGRGPYATDAQHVSVEFVHPVIVGKRALPALDLSPAFRDWLPAVVRPGDIVMGFGPPEGDPDIIDALRHVRSTGVQIFALGGGAGDYVLDPPTTDPFIHQEIVEQLYHTLWETVHVFFEHRELGHDVGRSAFLYPFLGHDKQNTEGVVAQVAASIRAKSGDDQQLRLRVAETQSEQIVRVADAVRQRIDAGGMLILFGNGGSATDANDCAIDCATPSRGARAVPAISLSMEPATLTAVANDVGAETMFLRQLIAHARPQDVAIAISTSGGSANLLAALEEARRRGVLTVALLGNDGGEIVRRTLADFALVVPSDYIPRIQEVQASIYHVLVEMLQSPRASES
jgi:D-sedoheptulose 7-phosphate isomerase